MLDHLEKRVRVPNVAVMDAEMVYRVFLVRGKAVALKARDAYTSGGRKKLRKFAQSLEN